MRRLKRTSAFLAAIVVVAGGIFALSLAERPESRPPGGPRLVSVEDLPASGDYCEPGYDALPRQADRFLRFGEASVYAASQDSGQTRLINRPPTRTIRDMDPIYSSVAVDLNFDEVVLMDQNNWALRIFNRLDNTPAGVPFTEPKRVIQGPETEIQYNNGIYIDPKTGDIYSIETDTGDEIVIFPREANGNVKPARVLKTPHRGFALAVDEEKQELYVGVQHPPQVAVYRKGASGNEQPLRSLQGESTRLSDVHGIALDHKNKLMVVTNWGHVSDSTVAGTGRFEDPSISVYPMGAAGDMAPLRVIQGSLTQLNWPAQMSIDPDNGDIYVANDIGHSVLVFKQSDKGNVAPTRIIKGNRSGLMNPSGVFVDSKHKELWVANFGNASVVVYPLNANGNVAPVRTIRSAPEGKVSTKFGKVEALAYDSRRDQIWVPN
jgi:6-phosphogluconolactonase (cycloisomerase 2 family)